MSRTDKNGSKVVLSRRGFLKAGGAAVGTVVLGGMAGCGNDYTKVITTSSDTTSTNTSSANWYGTEPTISSVVEEVTTDILICGAGSAGLIAALAASEISGKKVLVIEKNSSYGSIKSDMGALNTASALSDGVKFDAVRKTKVLNEMGRYAANNHCDLALVRTWIDESGSLIDWLAGYMSQNDMTQLCEYDVGDGYDGVFPVYPVHNIFYPNFMGAPVTKAVYNTCVTQGVEFRFSTPLVKLIKGSGTVTGAYAKNDKGYIKITASTGVLLATGGYGNDSGLFAQLNPFAASVTTFNFTQTGAVGDGIKAGIWAGGHKQIESTAMLFNRGSVKPGVTAGYPFPSTDKSAHSFLGSQPFLKVNLNGERFCNESGPYDWPVYASAYNPGGVHCMIFDANYYSNMEAFHTLGCSREVPSTTVPATHEAEDVGPSGVLSRIQTLQDAGICVTANSFAELANLLKIPADTLQATVNKYNQYAASGVDTDFGKPAKDLIALSAPPYYGITFGAALLTTLDGLIINKDSQVIDNNRDPIKGLYAAGDTSGGFFCGNYPELFIGSACGRTTVEARHAILHMTGQLSKITTSTSYNTN